MALVPFIYLLGRLFGRLNAFCRNYLEFFFKSAICRIFRDPGSPGSPLFPCLSKGLWSKAVQGVDLITEHADNFGKTTSDSYSLPEV